MRNTILLLVAAIAATSTNSRVAMAWMPQPMLLLSKAPIRRTSNTRFLSFLLSKDQPQQHHHKKRSLISRCSSDDNNDNNNNAAAAAAATEEASLLLDRARQARRDADRLEQDLVQSKLATLQSLLERQSQLSEDDERDIQDRMDQLNQYNNGNRKAKPLVVVGEVPVVEVPVGEAVEKKPVEDDENYVEDLQPDDRQALEQVQSIFLEFKEILNETMAADHAKKNSNRNSNNAAAAIEDEEEDDFWVGLSEFESDLNRSLAGNITQDELAALKGLQGIATNLWNWSGLNETDWQYLKGNVTSSMIDAKNELDNDPDYYDRIELLQDVFPMVGSLQKDGDDDPSTALTEADMEVFVEQVILPLESDNANVFRLKNTTAKKIGSVYLLQGTTDHKQSTEPTTTIDGDELLNAIDAQLVFVGLQDKYQYYYIRDPTRSIDDANDGLTNNKDDGMTVTDTGNNSGDEVQIEIDLDTFVASILDSQAPALLVTSPNKALLKSSISVEEPHWRGAISTITILWMAHFAADCYDQPPAVVLFGLTSPILFGILAIQLVHEFGHLAAAVVHKIDIAFPPILYPSASIGLLTTNTEFKSPPRNNNARFDFALMGPLLGLMASWSMLLYGIQLTGSLHGGAAQLASLPHMPLEFFQLSTLTSATIQTFLGTDVLLSIDPLSDTGVAVHPFMIAGHVGILVNALNLLPISAGRGTTDGNRLLKACIGDDLTLTSNLFLGFGSAILLNGYLLVEGFRVWGTSSYLLVYLFLVPFVQNDTDVPNRNNVDPAGGARPVVLAALSLLALAAVTPTF